MSLEEQTRAVQILANIKAMLAAATVDIECIQDRYKGHTKNYYQDRLFALYEDVGECFIRLEELVEDVTEEKVEPKLRQWMIPNG